VADELNTVIEIKHLTKRYGESIFAVRDLSMEVRRGEIYGFLGPNGAGKTTTLRMLVGLIRPTSGEISVLGEEPGTPNGLARIGSMIETPAFYPFLSGADNLKVLAKHGGVDEARIPAVLKQVDLLGRGGDKFSAYSLGMKQRLGVAAALLKDPELLILDEPTNGLDPAGMAEMRDLIRSLAHEHRSVIISSHLMMEIEQVCDRVGVIRRGEMVAEGTVDELRPRETLRVRTNPLVEARALVASLHGIDDVEIVDGALRVSTDPAKAASINRTLIEAGFPVSELHIERASLEEIFFSLTRDEEEEKVAA
jgi:ABC-2 type transport system ATP-binding protein